MDHISGTQCINHGSDLTRGGLIPEESRFTIPVLSFEGEQLNNMREGSINKSLELEIPTYNFYFWGIDPPLDLTSVQIRIQFLEE